MSWIIFHVGSGHAYFGGIFLIILGVIVTHRHSSEAGGWIAKLIFLLGTALIAISSAPLPFFCHAIALAATILWALAKKAGKLPKWGTLGIMALWSLMFAVEIPFHFLTRPTPASSRSFAIIGDSITAGHGGSDQTLKWPALMAEKHKVDIHDFSQPGATVAMALKRIRNEQFDVPIVILEIGGNDLLGNKSYEEFEQDLDQLLRFLAGEDRQLIMLETPLPPFCNRFGAIQRKLAKKHNVILIPKRFFLAVITSEGSTVDSLHLTQSGHEQMAAMVWGLIGSAFPENDASRNK